MKKITHILFILVLLALVGVGVYRYKQYKEYQEYLKYAPLWSDQERIATEDYNVVFFSTFPIDHYSEEDFVFYRNLYPLKASYCIPDMETLNDYFTRVAQCGNDVEKVYLGVRPDIITADDVLSLLNTWGGMHFNVIIAYPSLEYWKNLNEEEFSATLDAYINFVNTLMEGYEENEWLQNNLSLYFYNSTEWLVGNKTNYDGEFNVNEGMSRILFLYLDEWEGSELTLENYEEKLEDFENLVAACQTEETTQYPDLSKWDVVFFGDSVMAFSTTTSIPSAFSGLTGAHIYNCSQGGSSATMVSEESLGFPKIVDAFLTEDLSCLDENSDIYAAMTDYFEHAKKKRQKCFVINFGLNDFFWGYPIQNDDPYDTHTYAGALRTAVDKLQAAYPDATIILLTPNYTSYFGNGLEPQSDVGGTMPDYVSAVISICEEKDLLLYDSYNRLGIDSSNHKEYLLDGTHPNEATRYTMAQGLAKLLEPSAEQK